MSGKRYPEEFKIQAVEQVTKQGHSLASVSERLGISYKSLSDWIKRYISQQVSVVRMMSKMQKFSNSEPNLNV